MSIIIQQLTLTGKQHFQFSLMTQINQKIVIINSI